MADLLDLTTVCQPAEDLGALAARCLLEMLDHPEREPQELRMPTQLYVRGSTAARRREPRPKAATSDR
jgi:DNA-binding LacI/PurR family transcriptional regulator